MNGQGRIASDPARHMKPILAAREAFATGFPRGVKSAPLPRTAPARRHVARRAPIPEREGRGSEKPCPPEGLASHRRFGAALFSSQLESGHAQTEGRRCRRRGSPRNGSAALRPQPGKPLLWPSTNIGCARCCSCRGQGPARIGFRAGEGMAGRRGSCKEAPPAAGARCASDVRFLSPSFKGERISMPPATPAGGGAWKVTALATRRRFQLPPSIFFFRPSRPAL